MIPKSCVSSENCLAYCSPTIVLSWPCGVSHEIVTDLYSAKDARVPLCRFLKLSPWTLPLKSQPTCSLQIPKFNPCLLHSASPLSLPKTLGSEFSLYFWTGNYLPAGGQGDTRPILFVSFLSGTKVPNCLFLKTVVSHTLLSFLISPDPFLLVQSGCLKCLTENEDCFINVICYG